MATPAKNWKLEWEEQSKYARKLAKRANQRMPRLEILYEKQNSKKKT